MKYIEFGIRNSWIVRTETELPDGTEFEQKGIVKPLKPQPFYVRAWIGKTVLIAHTKEGLKKRKKILKNSNYYSALEASNKSTETPPKSKYYTCFPE